MTHLKLSHMPNILVQYPMPDDVTSYYRGAWPLTYLKRLIPKLNLKSVTTSTFDEMIDQDILFLQRPCLESHARLAQMAKEMGLKIWIDFDDYLFEIPEENPRHAQYATDSTRGAIASCLLMADVISVTTEYLKEKLTPFNKEIVVIPNAFDDYGPLLARRKLSDKRDYKISWRGSMSHQKDLLTFRDAIGDLDDALPPQPSWSFFGFNPWFLSEDVYRGKHHAFQSYFQYMAEFQREKPMVNIVPLYDHPFNRAKSNIAWIEATYAGAVTIAPSWGEWQRPGIVNYESVTDFYAATFDVMEDFDEYKGCVLKSWEYIEENLMLSHVNKQRAKLIEGLLK